MYRTVCKLLELVPRHNSHTDNFLELIMDSWDSNWTTAVIEWEKLHISKSVTKRRASDCYLANTVPKPRTAAVNWKVRESSHPLIAMWCEYDVDHIPHSAITCNWFVSQGLLRWCMSINKDCAPINYDWWKFGCTILLCLRHPVVAWQLEFTPQPAHVPWILLNYSNRRCIPIKMRFEMTF